jgi:mannose/cellobiose epimerase-like protein (N-acyl-D-glucosamine 2-epimerase family)
VPLLRAAAATARVWLFEHALPLWWDRGYDREARCFHERLALDGAPVTAEPRRVRVQARQTVVYARAGRLGWHGPWREAVEAGAEVLVRRCLRPDGGTHHLLAPDGAVLDDRRDLYDSAFAILALAEAAQALENSQLAAAAAGLADWVWSYWAHPEGGLDEGEVCPAPPRRQNPHMHLFEALLALYEATGEEDHLEQASALAALFQRKFFDPQHGTLPEYFDESWRPMSDLFGRLVEPGHQFEWSWLLLRWGALVGEGRCDDEAERLRLHGETLRRQRKRRRL